MSVQKMKPKQFTLEAICQKHDIPLERAKAIIIEHHTLAYLTPKKCTLTVNLDAAALTLIRRYAKALKVSHDAVITEALKQYVNRV